MNKDGLAIAAKAVRVLAMDAVQKANSGHPGMPMGCAELGVLIYGELLRHNPGDPGWINRDRFILSAGHGSMLLYSLLHLSGYDLPLAELKNFRQLGSKTPGHPEYGLTPGVETTTGPLGQGISNAVGMAMAETHLAARFNCGDQKIIDHFTYVIVGDGDLMEGVSSEACSLAGHLGLGKLIVFYDSNRITIEGSTDLAFTEDVLKRFDAYNWQTLSADAYDPEEIAAKVVQAKRDSERPALILVRSVIGKGSPHKAGSHEIHGAPLGEEEIRAAKEAMGVGGDSFSIPKEAAAYFADKLKAWKDRYQQWQELFSSWSKANPELLKEWQRFFKDPGTDGLELPEYKSGDKLATRKASGAVLNALAQGIPNLIGGSADLAPSNNTAMKGLGDFQKNDRSGRNFHFGVREHAMGSVVNGMALYGGLRVFCATFLVFSDYMRPRIRLAPLMKLPVIYVFTHDSIFVGEDGPTHQPVEHIAALRTIPGLHVLRPGDAEETREAWKMAIENNSGPTALILTRQALTVFPKYAGWVDDLKQGACIARDSVSEPETILVATGSEVGLALDVADILGPEKVRVVSIISRELFRQAPAVFQRRILPVSVRREIIEAGVSFGWGDLGGHVHSIERFGESGPAKDVAEHLGMTAAQIAAKIKSS